MKSASAAQIAILSGGQYLRADLYSFTLTTGATYYFTSFDIPLTTFVYPSNLQNAYLTGLTLTRGTMTQASGLATQEMDLKISPQLDNPGGQPLIGGYTFTQACRLGLLDNASVLYSKMYLNYPQPGQNLDTSPGAIAWFQGVVAELEIRRFEVDMKVSSNLIILNQVQMPRNLYQGGCSHTLYDAGCTLLKTSFTSTGTISSVTSNSAFNTSSTAADNYFALGVLKFTSGANAGFSTTVSSYLHTNGAFQLAVPMPAPIAVGDAYSVYPGCNHLQSTCSGKFNNLAHFKGMPYIPVPETLYDGGTSPNATSGVTTNVTPGSAVSGQINKR